MTTETGALGNLIQGVSQQTPRDRLEGQVSDQVNMTSDPVEGLGRRGSLDLVATLMTSLGDQYQWSDFILQSEDILVAWRSGDLKAFQKDGTVIPVTIDPSATAYLTDDALRFTSLDGKAYVTNPTVPVAMRADTHDDYAVGKTVVYLLGANYGRTYSITIEAKGFTTTASYTVPNGSQAIHVEDATATNVATELETALNADTVFTTDMGMTVTRQGDVLLIEWTNSADDTLPVIVTTEDGSSGSVMRYMQDTVSDVSRLSRYAPHRHLVRIEGDKADGSDDYFMIFLSDTETTTGAGFGTDGKWVESIGPGEVLGFDSLTMPHVLTGSVAGLTLAPGTWQDRRVGDSVSNPDPSFVGSPIEDVSAFQERLVLLSGPNLIMSRTKKQDDFWIESATTENATDPIDIRSTTKDVTALKHAIPFNRDLVVFAEPKAQFIVFGRNGLTPQNAALVLTTEFDAQSTARPVAAGRNIFFGFPAGRYSGVKEFFTEGSADVNDARPITEHVSKYLSGTIEHMTASTNFDILALKMTGAPKSLYIYEYVWSGGEKLQSAWSRWDFPVTVHFSFLRESTLYAVVSDADKAFLTTVQLDPEADDGVDFNIRLDMKARMPVTDQWLIDIGDFPYTVDTLRVVRGPDDEHAGMTVEVLDITGNQIRLAEYVTGDVYVGVRFRSSFRPTMPMKKDRNGVKIARAHLIVSDFDVSFTDTGHLAVTSISKERDDWTLEFEGRVVGSVDNLLGVVAITSGVFSFPFGEDADLAEIELWTDHHTPMTIPDIEYRAQVLATGRRL